MKWSRWELLNAKDHTIAFHETITFDRSAFSNRNQIRELQDVTVSGTIRYEEQDERAYADITVSGTMILPCSITNEDVSYPFHTSSLEVFAFEKCENEDVHETKGEYVELLPVIFQLIMMEIPLKVVKADAHYPKGNGWEVLKEEDYRKEQKNEMDPRLAKLREFKVKED